MNRLSALLLSYLIAFGPTLAQASLGRTLPGDSFEGFANALVNPSFERATYDQGWTYTTITRNSSPETSTIAPGSGKQSALLSFSATTGDIAQSLIPSWNTLSQSLEASCRVDTTLTTIQVCGIANGVEQNCQNAASTGVWQQVSASFTGPANGQTIGVRVKTTTSTTGTVYVDDCYVGPVRNATPRIATGTLTPSSTTSCPFTNTSSDPLFASTTPTTQGDCTGNFTPGLFSAAPMCTFTQQMAASMGNAPAANIPSITSSAIRVQATYLLTASSTVKAGSSPVGIICVGPR